jgi:hypothetical protein
MDSLAAHVCPLYFGTTMERTFELAIPNDKPGWAEVLDDGLLEQITSHLRTRRQWQIEDAVEGSQAGWLAYSKDEERQ